MALDPRAEAEQLRHRAHELDQQARAQDKADREAREQAEREALLHEVDALVREYNTLQEHAHALLERLFTVMSALPRGGRYARFANGSMWTNCWANPDQDAKAFGIWRDKMLPPVDTRILEAR